MYAGMIHFFKRPTFLQRVPIEKTEVIRKACLKKKLKSKKKEEKNVGSLTIDEGNSCLCKVPVVHRGRAVCPLNAPALTYIVKRVVD